MSSRLIGRRLRVRLYHVRLELFIGGTQLMALPRGRSKPNGVHGHWVEYRHLIHSQRRKPMQRLKLVNCDQLFPHTAHDRTFDRLIEALRERADWKMVVELLSLAHGRACEAELAALLSADMATNQPPYIAALRQRFADEF